jgi:hypothetical protein
MRTRKLLGNLTIFLVALGAGASVALAMADRHVWPRMGWHQDHYQAVASYIREHSQPDARIFVWGNSPEIYLYAKRRMATRYISVNYQTGHVWGTQSNDLGGHPDRKSIPAQSWDNLMADLERNKPVFIVDAAAGKLDKMDDEPISRHPRMAEFVGRSYRLDDVVMDVPIYKLR